MYIMSNTIKIKTSQKSQSCIYNCDNMLPVNNTLPVNICGTSMSVNNVIGTSMSVNSLLPVNTLMGGVLLVNSYAMILLPVTINWLVSVYGERKAKELIVEVLI